MNTSSAESQGSRKYNIIKGLCCSYDANFKLCVMNKAGKINNSTAAEKFNVMEANVRRKRKRKDELNECTFLKKIIPQSKNLRKISTV